MKNIYCSLVLLSILSYAGGDILPINKTLIDANIAIVPQNMVTEKNDKQPILVTSKEKVKKVVEVKYISKYYLGLTLSQASFDGNINIGNLDNGNPLGVIGKVGYNFSNNLAVEARAGLGLKKDSIGTVSNEWERIMGLYIKPKVDIMENIEIFGLLGYGAVKHKINTNVISKDGLSYGLGASYSLDKNWSLETDAVRYAKSANENMDTYSMGFTYKF